MFVISRVCYIVCVFSLGRLILLIFHLIVTNIVYNYLILFMYFHFPLYTRDVVTMDVKQFKSKGVWAWQKMCLRNWQSHTCIFSALKICLLECWYRVIYDTSSYASKWKLILFEPLPGQWKKVGTFHETFETETSVSSGFWRFEL